MKKSHIIILLLFVSSSVFAQKGSHDNKRPDKEKVKAMKIAYITEKLNLTPSEAQQFWPTYNEYSSKRDALRKKMHATKKLEKTNPTASDAEIAKRIEQHFKIREQELNLDKEYHTKFIKVLPIAKVEKLYIAEHDFMRELLRKMKKKNGGGKNGPPPPHR